MARLCLEAEGPGRGWRKGNNPSVHAWRLLCLSSNALFPLVLTIG